MPLAGRLTLALLAPVIFAAVGWLTYRIGFTVGRAAGYRTCVSEEDEDYPRRYAGDEPSQKGKL